MGPPESALFIPIVVNRDTGERDYAAYGYGADGECAALAANTVPRTWAAVRAAAERGQGVSAPRAPRRCAWLNCADAGMPRRSGPCES